MHSPLALARCIALLIALIVGVALPAFAETPSPAAAATPLVAIDRAALPLALTEPAGFQARLYQDGRVYIGGQPSEEALAAMKALGVSAIVNLRTQREPVLLHCTVAWRASYVWTAFLIRELGLPLDEALARGQAIAVDETPLGELVGRKLKLVWADGTP